MRARSARGHGQDAAGIDAAYAGAHEYARDGILLYNNEAQYELGAPTPLMLQWKVRLARRAGRRPRVTRAAPPRAAAAPG